jgi:hypothetical protein
VAYGGCAQEGSGDKGRPAGGDGQTARAAGRLAQAPGSNHKIVLNFYMKNYTLQAAYKKLA